MHSLVLLNSSPYREQLLSLMQQVVEASGSTLTLLAVAPHGEAVEELTAGLVQALTPSEQADLQVREGNFLPVVLEELRRTPYDLVLVGADPPEASTDHLAPAAHLAHLCQVPLGIVRSSTSHWHRALVCVRDARPESATARAGRELAGRLGLDPTFLHVRPAGAESQPSSTLDPGIQLRQGTVVAAIQAELARDAYSAVIIGPHRATAATAAGSGTTLVQPDIAQQIILLAPPLVLMTGVTEPGRAAASTAVQIRRTRELRRLVGHALLEVLIYGVLVVAYAAIAFRFLVEPLNRFFHSNLTAYAIIALVLIVGQGTLLEALTAFLLNRLRLERFD